MLRENLISLTLEFFIITVLRWFEISTQRSGFVFPTTLIYIMTKKALRSSFVSLMLCAIKLNLHHVTSQQSIKSTCVQLLSSKQEYLIPFELPTDKFSDRFQNFTDFHINISIASQIDCTLDSFVILDITSENATTVSMIQLEVDKTNNVRYEYLLPVSVGKYDICCKGVDSGILYACLAVNVRFNYTFSPARNVYLLSSRSELQGIFDSWTRKLLRS